MKKIIGLLAILSTFAVSASTVAIIDSGVDVKHEGLIENIWMNQNEIPDNSRDEDKNGYQDDVYGWNFAGQNNQVINYNYLGTFNDDVYRFFAIQAKQFRGTITRADRDWVNEKRSDQEFMTSLQKFGNFVHGTHVAGIAAQDAELTKILSVKLIPTEAKEQLLYLVSTYGTEGEEGDGSFKDKLIRTGLSALASAQADMLTDIGFYIAGHNADVANGSFGTGYPQAEMIIGMLYKGIFRKDPAPEDLATYAKFFISEMIKSCESFVAASNSTLFVFAAGNDGLNNDEFGTSPANIKRDNTISVAATFGRNKIAVFSNYGKNLVDIAAPGVIIRSEVPGNEYLEVSGTSQASPYIANVAARVKDVNPNLAPAHIKEILMGTVDKKDFLAEKVKSGGIVNSLRAVVAARYSLNLDLKEAIEAAKIDIADISESEEMESASEVYVVPVMPLPSLIK